MLIVGTIPAAVLGLAAEDYLDDLFEDPRRVGGLRPLVGREFGVVHDGDQTMNVNARGFVIFRIVVDELLGDARGRREIALGD